jgi:hypothetical protein
MAISVTHSSRILGIDRITPALKKTEARQSFPAGFLVLSNHETDWIFLLGTFICKTVQTS